MSRRSRPTGVDLAVPLGPLTLANPIVAASGTFGHGAEVAALCDPRGIGAVTTKSVAVFACEGNPPLRVAEAPGGGMINSVGLPGPGVDVWIARDLPALEARGARVIASIWGHTVAEFEGAARALKEVAHRIIALEVNLSCPNVEARAHVFAHAPATTRAATSAVVDALGGSVPVFAKLSPNVADLVEIAGAALDAGATGLTLVNTVMGLVVDASTRRPAPGRGWRRTVGAADQADRVARGVGRVARVPGVPIIGTGGVATGEDAVEMLLAGASAVGVGTATFLDPRATLRIVDELGAWCARNDVARRARPDRGDAMVNVRNRLALALDVPDLDRAEQLAKEVSPWFGVAKVGLELYSAAGPEAIARMRALDLEVFADIKLHDIPTTVGRAARVFGRQGVRYLNFHAAGGVEMLRAGVEGLAEGAADAGDAPAIPIAVTVLTSDADARAFDERLAARSKRAAVVSCARSRKSSACMRDDPTSSRSFPVFDSPTARFTIKHASAPPNESRVQAGTFWCWVARSPAPTIRVRLRSGYPTRL